MGSRRDIQTHRKVKTLPSVTFLFQTTSVLDRGLLYSFGAEVDFILKALVVDEATLL